MNDRFQSIRDALAMGPTPGPWEIKDGRTDTIENAQGYPVCTVHYHPYELYGHGARAAYIAACDPDTIRELLRQRDEMAKALEPFAAVAEHDIGDDETDSDIFIPISKRNARAKPITVGDMRKARAVIAFVNGQTSRAAQ